MTNDQSIAFGPVPSRRLGRSLGINNIPPKACSYSCVYCQLGRTDRMETTRRRFYGAVAVREAVYAKVVKARKTGEPIDYLTFVPHGEPTLDSDLGQEIQALQHLGIRIAVITNSSLIDRDDVRSDLAPADWVCLKVDSTSETVWRRINRPHRALRLELILKGMIDFARTFRGILVTETMLVNGVNDTESAVTEVAEFLTQLQPHRAYVTIPTRPPAEGWVRPPEPQTLRNATLALRRYLGSVELLSEFEGDSLGFTGDIEEDLLAIAVVHPVREDAMRAYLRRAGADWSVVSELLCQHRLVESQFGGHKFYSTATSKPRAD